MKDTAVFTRTVEEAAGPVIVTRNGYDMFVVMRTSDYDAMQAELAKARLVTRIAQAEKEYSEGLYNEGSEVFVSLREQYDL